MVPEWVWWVLGTSAALTALVIVVLWLLFHILAKV